MPYMDMGVINWLLLCLSLMVQASTREVGLPSSAFSLWEKHIYFFPLCNMLQFLLLLQQWEFFFLYFLVFLISRTETPPYIISYSYYEITYKNKCYHVVLDIFCPSRHRWAASCWGKIMWRATSRGYPFQNFQVGVHNTADPPLSFCFTLKRVVCGRM